jgi:hypothetical protein
MFHCLDIVLKIALFFVPSSQWQTLHKIPAGGFKLPIYYHLLLLKIMVLLMLSRLIHSYSQLSFTSFHTGGAPQCRNAEGGSLVATGTVQYNITTYAVQSYITVHIRTYQIGQVHLVVSVNAKQVQQTHILWLRQPLLRQHEAERTIPDT